MVGRSAAISVRRADRGLSFANSGSPGFRGGVRVVVLLRSISFSTLEAASAVVAVRLGSAS